MLCLTLATNAVVTWTTEYYALATTALRNAGRTTGIPPDRATTKVAA